jgi:hypothetical protein
MKDVFKVLLFSALGAIVIYFVTKFLKQRKETAEWMQTPIQVTPEDIRDIDSIWERRKNSLSKMRNNLLK